MIYLNPEKILDLAFLERPKLSKILLKKIMVYLTYSYLSLAKQPIRY